MKNLAVVSDAPISAHERPEPPPDLTLEQRLEWISVVNSLRADWFTPETFPVLAQYCRHVVEGRKVAQLIQRLGEQDEIDVSDYDKLLKMQERESRAIAMLGTKMRITQQASYHPDKTKGKGKVKSPWED